VCGQFSNGHRDFIAGVATGTVHAILHHLVAQSTMFDDVKTEVFEESRDAREEADALDASGLSLIQKGTDEHAAGSLVFDFGIDDDRADLGKVFAVDVEGGATGELTSAGFDDSEGLNVFADLRVGTVEEGVVAGEALDQTMDGAGVLQLRSTGEQRGRFEFAFGCDGGCE
jgi:hypothetical protein